LLDFGTVAIVSKSAQLLHESESRAVEQQAPPRASEASRRCLSVARAAAVAPPHGNVLDLLKNILPPVFLLAIDLPRKFVAF
jgi:hypothetical protein